MADDASADQSRPFDQSRLDDVIHGRLRLGIVAYLSTIESAVFTELRDKVAATDGNLSTHLRKLEDAGYVRVAKSFVDRKPQTRIALTDSGRKAWLAWLDQIRALTSAAGEENR